MGHRKKNEDRKLWCYGKQVGSGLNFRTSCRRPLKLGVTATRRHTDGFFMLLPHLFVVCVSFVGLAGINNRINRFARHVFALPSRGFVLLAAAAAAAGGALLLLV